MARLPVSRLNIALYSVIVLIGTVWAYTRGGQDYAVFYTAGQHVLAGQSEKLYFVSPDRYLYAPGGAWLFALLSLIPFKVALGLWTAFKIFLGGWALLQWKQVFAKVPQVEAATAIALIVTARFFLIDFQYGQINLVLFALGSMALLKCHKKEEAPWIWFWFAVVATIKPIAMPLLVLPLFRKKIQEIGAVVAGGLTVVLIPLIQLSFSKWWTLQEQWLEAIRNKGLPLYTHNQSFSAFLHRWLGESPSRPVFLPDSLDFSLKWLSSSTIQFLSWTWFAGVVGVLVWGLWRATKQADPAPKARLMALIPLPYYLIWKSYFIFGFPVVLVAALKVLERKTSRYRKVVFVLAGIALAISGFDLFGVRMGTAFESLSILMWAMLAMLRLSY
ncbi:DUF2029 domain-containing protein [bacterium]|jgi:hypothetical protein|nr:DUF2029 domain-containing protein [bacterium]